MKKPFKKDQQKTIQKPQIYPITPLLFGSDKAN